VTRDEMLTGWLVFIRMQFGEDRVPMVPTPITRELVARGWLIDRGVAESWNEDEEVHDGTVSSAGLALTDLAGPEWGVEPTFVGAE
jgi:hypothetical protein